MNDAFSPNRELLLDKRILGIATVPRRVTGCACGRRRPFDVLCKSSDGGGTAAGTGEAGTERGERGKDWDGGGRGGGCTANPRHLVIIIIMNFYSPVSNTRWSFDRA